VFTDESGSMDSSIVSAGQISTLLQASLLEIQKLTNYHGLAVSDGDIRELERARIAAGAYVASALDQMVEQARYRRHNLQTIASKYKIISIGEDCLSRSVATRWGLKPSSELGEKSHPFDLAVHPISSVASIIENRFDSYMNSENLYFSESEGVVRGRFFGISFNHEPGKHYADEGFLALREIYSRRVKNFQEDVAGSSDIVLLCHIQQPAEEPIKWVLDIERIRSFVEGNWIAKRIQVVSINTWRAGSHGCTDIVSAQGIQMIDVTYPWEDYIWHLPECFMNPAGYAFERNIVDRLMALLP
jgi:hypothetical protein